MGTRLSLPAAADLSGKVVIVTGANAGIGYETAKAVAAMGAHTILACRSEERAGEAIERMRQEVPVEFPDAKDKELQLEFLPLDLGSFQSTKQFATAFKEKNLPLHILINNAGALLRQGRTQDGYERHFQVNHLSHFLLTLELLPHLIETASSSGDGRIVFVASAAHKWGTFEPDNMNGEQSYGLVQFYGKSKLYNVLTAYALQRRLQNVGITVSSVHPGAVRTEAHRGYSEGNMFLLALGRAIMYLPGFCTAKEGAATSINCAVNPELNSQECFYYADCRPAESTPHSRDEQVQEQLWEMSVNIVKDYLSPEVLEKYGPAHTAAPPPGGEEGEEQQPTSTGGEEGEEQQPTSTGGEEEEEQQPASTEQTIQLPESPLSSDSPALRHYGKDRPKPARLHKGKVSVQPAPFSVLCLSSSGEAEGSATEEQTQESPKE